MAADQAIEGAVRYLNYLLTTQIANGSNGVFLTLDNSLCQAVPVGEAHYWLIGRDTNNPVGPGRLCFGLVDEASKLNLNMAASNPLVSSNQLIWLPRMTVDLTQAILDWVNTNGNGPTVTYYAMQQPPYQCKCEPFETVDELRLLYGADMDTLVGEDANRNGILDPNETDDNQNGMLDPGILEYVTVYSREPGSNLVNVSTVSSSSTQLIGLLQTNLGSSRAEEILGNLGVASSGPAGASGGGNACQPALAARLTRPAVPAPQPARLPPAAATCHLHQPAELLREERHDGDRVRAGRHEPHYDQRHVRPGAREREYRQCGGAGLPARGRHGGGAATGQLSPIQPVQSDLHRLDH